MTVRRMLIGGEWRTSAIKYAVHSPHNGELVAEVAFADKEMAESAVFFAAAGRTELARVPRHKRARGLRFISDAISRREDEFARSIVLESGKPWKYAIGEVRRAVSTFSIAAGEAERFQGELVPLDVTSAAEDRFGYTSFIPRGVVFGITPFNFPLNLVAHKVAPAIASGNAAIIKPSEKTPLTSLLLAEVFLESGLPASALQVVPMEIETLKRILPMAEIAMISFTGSENVGFGLRREYAEKHVALELGGNAPVIVDETANLEDAAARIAAGAYAYSGQVCISVQRIIVADSIAEKFKTLLMEKAKRLKRGDPLDPKTDIAEMITDEAAKNTRRRLDSARSSGAEVISFGEDEGRFVPPALVLNAKPLMEVMSEEVFAPIATFETFEKFEDAVKRANNGRFGLQAGVFSNNLENVATAIRELSFGGVIIGDAPTFRVDNMPYGGVAKSGIGREGIRWAMEDMCEIKMIAIRSGGRAV
ncbi:MAG: aldehyde dehydrogenase family protein [Pyrinomonadaceae bacterium]